MGMSEPGGFEKRGGNNVTPEEASAIIGELQNANLNLQNANCQLTATVEELRQQLDWFKRQLFGQKSERFVDPDPDAPLLPGFEEAPAPPEPEKETVNYERRKHRNQSGWQKLPDDLPREEVIIKLPEEERFGPDGQELKLIGYDVFERLAWRNSYFVKVFKREKYADPNDATFGVVTAPHPGDPLDGKSGKSKFDASFIAQMITEKCLDYLPLYRQQERLARVGIDVHRSTLCRLFGGTADLLTPLYERHVELILECEIIHADESSMKMLAPGTGKCQTAWLWCRMTGIGPPLTAFAFDLSRSGESAKKYLGEYQGTVIADQYDAYIQCENDEECSLDLAGCWAHARRYFEKALPVHQEEAGKLLKMIQQLYMVERQAKEQAAERGTEKALFECRQKLRAKVSRDIVDRIFRECDGLKLNDEPSSFICKAANYALNAQTRLRRFLSNPKINIDNNPAENAIRPIALGRKNYLFAGNETGGQNLAMLLSLLVTCKQNKKNPQAWLEDVLNRILTTPAREIDSLLPHLWQPTE
ncbi:MAG: IS66 family transposase [Victivallaceae bacterium]